MWEKDSQANFADQQDKLESESLFLTCHATNVCGSESWYVGSSYSNHMTTNLEAFINLDKSVTSRVKLADGTIHKAQGKGVVKVNFFGTSFINDVLYMPDLYSSLLSVGQFLCEGYSLLFEYFSCIIYKDKTKKNILFKVTMSRGNLCPLTQENDNKAMLVFKAM